MLDRAFWPGDPCSLPAWIYLLLMHIQESRLSRKTKWLPGTYAAYILHTNTLTMIIINTLDKGKNIEKCDSDKWGYGQNLLKEELIFEAVKFLSTLSEAFHVRLEGFHT